nr:sodium channel protein para isoform X2 [Parasteatoda tepidariorum]
MSADDQSDEEVVPIFRPFTRESLAAIEARIAEEKARKEHANKGEDGEDHAEPVHHQGMDDEGLEADPNLEAGMPLPKYLLNVLTPEVTATPLEDIDKFYENQRTFVVVSKGKDIFRFSATNALYLLSPFNPIRRVAIYLLVHPVFSFFVITTILTNCILMTFPSNPTIEASEIWFTLIYTCESIIKMLARGFILESFTYLRDPWNWLDFVVISLAYTTMLVDLGNLSALRTFRVFRALKTVAIVPGLKTIVGAVIESVKNLKDVIILTCFSLSIFALLGLQIYMGVLTHKCIKVTPWQEENLQEVITTPEFKVYADNISNQYVLDGQYEPKLCRPNAGLCPPNYTCLQGFGMNPNYGYTNFDTFGSALLSSFRLMTQDFWENLYQCILICAGPWHMCFFVVIIFLGSFYLVNLILAIVAMSYDELQKKAEEEEEAALAEEAAMQAEAARLLEEEEAKDRERRGEGVVKSPSDLSCNSYELFVGQEKGNEEKDSKERGSIRSAEGESIYEREQKARINNKMRKASLSLPGSPFNIRRGSRASQFSCNWRNGRRYGDRKPLVLQTLVDAQEHLPYADDSNAVTPMSEENGAIIIPVYTNLPQHSSYTSHSSRISYNSHSDIYGKGLTKESQLRSRSRFLLGLYNEEMENDEYMIPKNKQPVDPFMDPGDPRKRLDMKDVMVLNDIIEQAAGRQSKASERVSVYYFPTDREEEEEEEKLKFKERCLPYCLKCIDVCCIWDCCTCWIYFQEFCSIIVFDPFMELFITLCIVVNTLFMAMDHHNMNPDFEAFLKNGNYFFTATFAIEAGMKLIAMSPKYYFQDGWNIFDFFIVALSLLELSLEGVQGLSVLRSFRLLRVFKLAKSWPTLNLLISIMGKTVGALGNLTFVLGIIIFIFAVMGMQLFGDNYRNNKERFHDHEVPRWNFTDFMHSFMIVFRVLCGEWIESMWDCMVVSGWPCVPFFLATVVIGNLVVLNLFLALLLSSFGASNLSQAPAGDDTKGIAEAFNRIGRAKRWVKNKLLGLLKGLRAKVTNQISDHTESGDGEDMPPSLMVDGQVPSKEKKSPKEKTELEIALDGYELGYQEDGKAIKIKNKSNSMVNSVRMGDKVQPKDNKEMKLFLQEKEVFGNKIHPQKDEDNLSNNKEKEVITEKPSSRHSSSPNDTTDDEKKDASKEDLGDDVMAGTDIAPQTEGDVDDDKLETNTADVIIAEYPADCCPDTCYTKIACCAEEAHPEFWSQWKELRGKMFILIEDKYFETIIITMIMISSLALAAEDVNIGKRPMLQAFLTYMDKVFTVLFFIEMIIKWIALGFRKYFTNAWCWLDFVIVLVSIFNLAVGLLGFGNIPAFKTMRTLRALRPLRALSRLEGMRVVVNALIQAIPAICNVLLVCLIFWLIFAIMGVQLFGGKYFYCTSDGTPDGKFNITEINDKDTCLAKNFTWANYAINFDNVLNAYLALFQVATFKGWIDIMYCAVDTRQVDEQPDEEGNLMMYLYFVLFIIIGSFFTLNLFIGVIIDNFNEQKKKGGSLEMFMTEDQKKYYNAMKKMGDKKPVKAIPRPRFKPQAIVFDLTTNTKFDMAIMLFIGMNMIVMAMDHYQIEDGLNAVLDRLNVFFIAVFTTECVLKIFAFRWHYFKEPWNVFDFVVVSLSILGVVLKDLIEKYFVSPTLLRVVRVVKVGRVLRLVKGARGIRTLLFALAMSLPALFNICLLLFLVMFIYAIFGMSFFMHVKHRYGIDENFNFETFGQSMILLFQMSTSAGWDGVLAGIMADEDCDPPDPDNDVPGSCGSRGIAVAYLVTYLIISFLIIINMYIAVILENYSQATEDVQEGLTADDYDMYYEIWQRFDPDGTQFIKYEYLSDFLDALEEPLQIPKPNKYKIISMDIAICKGDLIFCVDILDALTKDFFARKGHVIEENAEIAEVVPNKDRGGLEAISSTLYRQREEYAARVLQQAFKRLMGMSSSEPKPQQTAIVVESDGHVTKNGHKVVIHSRSPSVTSRSTNV